MLSEKASKKVDETICSNFFITLLLNLTELVPRIDVNLTCPFFIKFLKISNEF